MVTKQDIEQQIGESVKVQNPQWARYLRAGVIVDLHISRWRATEQLNLADLGVVMDDPEAKGAMERFVRAGRRLLLPPAYLKRADSLETSCRLTLRPVVTSENIRGGRMYAYRTHWGAFLPAESFVAWKQQFDTLKAKYMALLEEICENWDALKDEVQHNYIAMARDVYQRNPVGQWSDVEAAVKSWVDNHFIARDAIRNTWRFDYEVSYLPLPMELVQEEEEARMTAAQTILRDELMKSQRQAKLRLVSEFETGMMGQLYSVTYEAASTLLDMVKKAAGEQIVSERVRRKIMAIKDQITVMDVFGEEKLTEAVRELEKAGGTKPDDVAVAIAELQTYLKVQLESLRLDSEREGRQVEVVTASQIDEVRRQREVEEPVAAEAEVVRSRRSA